MPDIRDNISDNKKRPQREYQEAQNALKNIGTGQYRPNNVVADVPLTGVDLPFAMPQYCGDFQMRILADGTWLYQNSPIGRKPLCKLFASVMHRDDKGDYWLVTPAERGRIQVDVAPFTFVEYQQKDDGLHFRSNLDEWVRLDANHPLQMANKADAEPLPLITLRGRLQGLITRSVFYHLVEIAQIRDLPHHQQEMIVQSAGCEFTLGCF